MRVPRAQARSRPVALIWIAALLAVGAATLGIVHHASLSRVRRRAGAEPVRPIALVELARNKPAHASDSSASSDAWLAAAAALGRTVETYSAENLAEIPTRSYAVWILVNQTELDDSDFAALDSYLQLGGGAVLAGRTAAQPVDGRTALERIFPGQHFAELGSAATQLRVTGASPLVAGFAAGEELAVEPGAHSLAASSADALAWGGDAGGAALQVVYRGGAVAWLGVSPERVAESTHARVLAENALRYALREPLLDLRAWPDGRPCAVLVESPSHKDKASACRVERDADAGESLRELSRAGCRYASVPPDGRALPELVDVDGKPLVTIPEDRADAAAVGSALMRELLAGYERAERIGGVYSLRADAGWRAKSGRQDLYTRVSRELRERGAWFAEPEELARWWSARSGVRADLAVLGRDRVRVTFANPGKVQARGVTARVYLPAGADTARIESAPSFRAQPGLRVAGDHGWIEVIEPALDPGSEVSYTIRF
ncbi:MAG TPA: hypothetical protein VMR50_00860 [Myxococcota bacterium]|nr:hypothetical protein [Myxococcota bacterium]